MADETKRIDMVFPGTVGVVGVPEDRVEHWVAQGWKKVRASRHSDTATGTSARQNIQ